MNIIRVLPEQVASQIAAGEVIDRPAAIVKELMENSIDARADRITVRIEQGGKRLIKVSDNGIGMSRDDLLLCVERHATSKLRKADDLSRVSSLGFRGEALPSMAAVSRLQITSLPKDEMIGHRLRISGGKVLDISESGAPPGTSVTVEDLFFNMPARRKFLRTHRTEQTHIMDGFIRSAVPFSDIHFSLADGTKKILTLYPSSDPRERLSGLLGREVSRSMVEGGVRMEGIEITLYAAPSDFSRNRGDRIYAYVNRRNIRDRLVTRAIMEGYGQRLMKGKFPQIVLFIEMPPGQVDVNVHPTKQEVRFRETQKVFQAVVSAVHRAFSPVPGTRTPVGPGPPSPVWKGEPTPKEAPHLPFTRGVSTLGESPGPYARDASEWRVAFDDSKPDAGPSLPPGHQIIGQLGNTYILCQIDDGLLLIDQHAAHERIVYERLIRAIQSSGIQSQTLLIPHELTLSSKDKEIALTWEAQLHALGLDLGHFGGDTFILRAVPAMLQDVNWEAFISQLLTELTEGQPGQTAIMEKAIIVMACHGAIRAGQRMSHEEMARLLNELSEMNLPTNCPHGRPICRQLSYRELEKMFKRVV
jgi:DNA mismatch repair protein MutL